jgi:hypothetical protein
MIKRDCARRQRNKDSYADEKGRTMSLISRMATPFLANTHA